MAGNKKKGGGIGKVIACLLLVVIIGLGASWGTGFALTGEANPGNWKKQNSEAVTPNTVAVTNDGQLMESGNVYNMPASGFTFLSARSTSSETTEYVAGGEVTLSAELSNEYINGKIEWSVNFPNPSSAWATGKVADYFISLTPSEDSRQVTLKYLAPFSEQIILTATLQGSESSDTCTIDCLYQVTSIVLSEREYYFEDYVCLSMQGYYNEIGTLKGDYTFKNLYISIDEDFRSQVKNYLKFDIVFKPYVVNSFSELIEPSFDTDEDGFYLETNEQITPALFIEDFDTYDEAHQNAIKYAWYAAQRATNNSNNAYIDYGTNYNYKGTLIQSLEESDISFYVSARQYSNLTPSVTLNKNYVF